MIFEATGINDLKGLSDIRYLLQHPDPEGIIDIYDLPNNECFCPPSYHGHDATKDYIRLPAHSVRVCTKSGGDAVKEALREDKERLDNETDFAKQKELQNKIDQYEDYLNQNFNKKGDPRVLPGDQTKLIKTTQARLRRTKKHIQRVYPQMLSLIEHLDKRLSIAADGTCSYTPNSEIRWDCGEEI